jgi:hypothetical protein
VFIVDVIASANDGRLEVPDPMIGALKAELNRIRTAKLEAAEDLAHCVEPMDSIAFRQRQVDAVAARLRGDGGRWTR